VDRKDKWMSIAIGYLVVFIALCISIYLSVSALGCNDLVTIQQSNGSVVPLCNKPDLEKAAGYISYCDTLDTINSRY
jgi:hypothetical protein